ncbi:MAG: class I SAM-dependent methyltransferase, partial [Dehalococcoidia bacterium]|nr:class I SAM-dependent methyltransferase [Dehalococcoidia bacterium]
MNFEEYEKMSRYEAGNWWWEGKGRLITRELKGIGKNPLRILDVGCGTGSNLKRWKNYGEVHGLDFSCDAINFCKIKGNEMLSRGDAASLPFADSSFDTI